MWLPDGTVEVVIDDPGRAANTVSRRYHDGMEALLGELESNREKLRGVIISSAKRAFFSGDDVGPADMSPDDIAAAYELASPIKNQLRRLERLDRPVVAAITGSALGFGMEITIACHYRIGLDAPGIVYGLPEVKMGILPAGGGLVRVTRMLGVARGFREVIGTGSEIPARQALEIGLIDEVAGSRERVIAAAHGWIDTVTIGGQPGYIQRWDRDDYRIPGGKQGTSEFDHDFRTLSAEVDAREAHSPVRTLRSVVDLAAETTRLDIDTALAKETELLSKLLASPLAPQLAKIVFAYTQSLRNGNSVPDSAVRPLSRLAVLGDSRLASLLRARILAHGIEVVTAHGSDHPDMLIDARPMHVQAKEPMDRTKATSLLLAVDVEEVACHTIEADDAPVIVLAVNPTHEPVAEILASGDDDRAAAINTARAIGFVPITVRNGGPSYVARLRAAFLSEVDKIGRAHV